MRVLTWIQLTSGSTNGSILGGGGGGGEGGGGGGEFEGVHIGSKWGLNLIGLNLVRTLP